MKIKKAIIPLGGLATRFLPASKSVPKTMFPVVDKPILQYLIEELSESGVTEILLLVGRNNEAILNHFDKTPELDDILLKENKIEFYNKAHKPCTLANILYKRVYEPKGVADVVLQAEHFVNNEPFIVAFGDEMFYNKEKSAVQQMIEIFEKTNTNIIGCYNVDKKDVHKYGIMKTQDENGFLKVKGIVEKPKPENAPSTLSAVGKYILKSEVFDILKELNNNKFNKEKNFTEALDILATNDKLIACDLIGERYDTGSKTGYLLANVAYGLKDEEINQQFKN